MGISWGRGPAARPMLCPTRPCWAVVDARNCGTGEWNDVSTSKARLRRHTPEASSDASPAMLPMYSFGAGESWKNVNRSASGTFSSAAVTVRYWSLAAMRMAALPAPRGKSAISRPFSNRICRAGSRRPCFCSTASTGWGVASSSRPVPCSFRESSEPSSPTTSVAQRVS
jgi:hypothetical protein